MNLQRYREIGRAMATIMSDEIFNEVPYKAKNKDQLVAGIDTFLDAVTVLPPGNNIIRTFDRFHLDRMDRLTIFVI